MSLQGGLTARNLLRLTAAAAGSAEGDNNASLLGILADQQDDPARDNQLSAHLERLPQEDEPYRKAEIGRQEGGRFAQRGRNARSERVPTRPQQDTVEQGNRHRPHKEKCNRCVVGALVLDVCIARDRQVCGKVAPRLAIVVFDPLEYGSLSTCSAERGSRGRA
eukprot:1256337-Prymnesium_polylepis.1